MIIRIDTVIASIQEVYLPAFYLIYEFNINIPFTASGPSGIIRGITLFISTSQEIVAVILCLNLVARLKVFQIQIKTFLESAKWLSSSGKKDEMTELTLENLKKSAPGRSVGLLTLSSNYNDDGVKNVLNF